MTSTSATRLAELMTASHFRPVKIEQRCDMATCDNAALANFELLRIDHGQSMFTLVYDLPLFFTTRHAKVAWIHQGKFDHLPLPSDGSNRIGPAAESGRAAPRSGVGSNELLALVPRIRA